MAHADLYNILDEIKKYPDISSDEELIRKFYDDFEQIYTSQDFRHSYYEISLYIEELAYDERDSIEGNIEIILDFANNINNSSDTTKRLAKLLDHISLERLRLARIDRINHIGKKISDEMNSAKNEIAQKKTEIKDIDNKISNMHSETITILGIFAGLVIGFATSFQLLAKSLENINSVYFCKMIIYLAFIGIILFDCLFFLMFAISRISGRSLALRCKYEDCSKCPKDDKKCKNSLKSFIKKYSYVFWFNLVLSLVIFICALFKIITNYIIA